MTVQEVFFWKESEILSILKFLIISCKIELLETMLKAYLYIQYFFEEI